MVEMMRAYLKTQSEEEGKKGHHHKEDHEGEYHEASGHKKNHYDDSG